MKKAAKELLIELNQEHEDFLVIIHQLRNEESYLDRDIRQEIINKGFDYISNHMIREERIMSLMKYPFLEEHENSHNNLQKTFLIIIRELLQEETSQETFITLIEETFEIHITTLDKKFFDWIKENQ